MKKSSILLCLLFILCNSYSQQNSLLLNKAKTLIKKQLFLTINDFNSYQPVSYSKVDKLYTSPSGNEQIVKEYKELNAYKDATGTWSKFLSLNDTTKTDTVCNIVMKLGNSASEKKLYTEAQEYYKIASNIQFYRLYQIIILKSLHEFKPEFIGMKVIHKYRSKNPLGAYILKTSEFRFNKNMTTILEVVDLD